jgi:hypothetical protein
MFEVSSASIDKFLSRLTALQWFTKERLEEMARNGQMFLTDDGDVVGWCCYELDCHENLPESSLRLGEHVKISHWCGILVGPGGYFQGPARKALLQASIAIVIVPPESIRDINPVSFPVVNGREIINYNCRCHEATMVAYVDEDRQELHLAGNLEGAERYLSGWQQSLAPCELTVVQH